MSGVRRPDGIGVFLAWRLGNGTLIEFNLGDPRRWAVTVDGKLVYLMLWHNDFNQSYMWRLYYRRGKTAFKLVTGVPGDLNWWVLQQAVLRLVKHNYWRRV